MAKKRSSTAQSSASKKTSSGILTNSGNVYSWKRDLKVFVEKFKGFTMKFLLVAALLGLTALTWYLSYGTGGYTKVDYFIFVVLYWILLVISIIVLAYLILPRMLFIVNPFSLYKGVSDMFD